MDTPLTSQRLAEHVDAPVDPRVSPGNRAAMARDDNEELPDEAAGAGADEAVGAGADEAVGAGADEAVGAGAGIAVTPDWSKHAGGFGTDKDLVANGKEAEDEEKEDATSCRT